MKLESIACNNCGAPLQVPESVNYVTCNHCESHLVVKRRRHVTYTEKIKEIDQRTEQMQDEMQRLKIDNELGKLDRQWDLEKENYMIKDKDGHQGIPTTTGSVVGGIVSVVFGVFWTGFATSMTSGSSHAGTSGIFGCFPMFGVLFILVGIGVSIYSYMKAKDYLDAERRYRRRRSELMEKKHKRE